MGNLGLEVAMGSSLVSCWDLSNAYDRPSGSKSPMSTYFPVSTCLSIWGGIGGRLVLSKAFAATFNVSVVVVAVDAPDMDGVCAMAWEEANPIPCTSCGEQPGWYCGAPWQCAWLCRLYTCSCERRGTVTALWGQAGAASWSMGACLVSEDESLHGRNVLFINSLLRPLLRSVADFHLATLRSNEPLQHDAKMLTFAVQYDYPLSNDNSEISNLWNTL